VSPWSILGIQATSDEREIKRAYARKLKVTRPEDNQQAFQDLRDAYEATLRLARFASEHGAQIIDEPDEAEDEPPVYTAFYEWATDSGNPAAAPLAAIRPQVPEAQEYIGLLEFEPVEPMTAARRVWADFLTSAHRDTAEELRQLERRGDMLDLEVRECFELCAVQYCAGEGCDDEFRVALAEHFHWEANYDFIFREMPDETAAMMARLHDYRCAR
jgi:hypothetical protein